MKPIVKSGGALIVVSPHADAHVYNLPERVPTAEDPAAALSEHLVHYPSAKGWALPEQLRFFPSVTDGGPG